MTTCSVYSSHATVIIKVLQQLGINYTINSTNGGSNFLIVDSSYGVKFKSSLPTIILSTSGVYSCLDLNNKVVETPFTESSPLLISDTAFQSAQVQKIYDESICRKNLPNHMVLRLCNLYGLERQCDIIDNIVHHFRHSNEFSIFFSPYRKKSFLYKLDFESLLLKIIPLFLSGLRGVYNVGGNDIITIGNLVETIYQILHQTSQKPKVTMVADDSEFYNFYESVDSTRIRALTNWEPQYSIRKGIWSLVQEKLWANQSNL